MPDGPYLTPGEEAVLRMTRGGATPEDGVRGFFARLENLERVAAQLEAAEAQQAAAHPETGPEATTGEDTSAAAEE